MRLSDYLDAAGEEAAARQAIAWIKSLRLARVDGTSFRERFTYSGDSLWWFAELYLHKERTILALFRALHAASALVEREAPAGVRLESGGRVPRLVLPALARQRGIRYDGPLPRPPIGPRWLAMDARSTALMIGAVASPARPARRPATTGTTVAAFVHRAFWQSGGESGGAEAYIGPVLQTLERRLPGGTVEYIGVGPVTNFRARRWWRPAPATHERIRPVEALVPRAALAGSVGLWAARHAMRRALETSTDLREAAVVNGCDLWPLVVESLDGVALLQFPWSARAMDEGGAALDASRPSVAVTYAEAGGWGRALALETRRRGVPLAGLQHGFIYRHWLNYLHEPDEMAPSPSDGPDAGFPRPAATLVFDDHAARHLIEAGRFPPATVVVTGSPRLDQLAGRYRTVGEAEVSAARRAAGAVRDDAAVVLLVTKYVEVQRVLADLLAAFGDLPSAHLVIKTHPAETPEPYEAASAGAPNVRVLPATAELAPLLRAARAIVTVNSTVALDGLALGIPGLSIGLPNNLSPFVAAGALAGAGGGEEIARALRRLLYDEEFRRQLCDASAGVTATYRMIPDGRAAERQADAILGLVQPEQ